LPGHDGCSNNGSDNLSSALLGKTAATAISSTTGWQTVPLLAAIPVDANTKIWLAWVFDTNPGFYYQTGTPGRADGTTEWAVGMPNPFGTSTTADFIYSINATYTKGTPIINKEIFVSSFTGSRVWSYDRNISTWAQLHFSQAAAVAGGKLK
jgi:hypothetical protein